MRPDECGFSNPPADGTREREILDRFADFLRVAGPAVTPKQVEDGEFSRRSPASRYRLRYMAWRMTDVALDLAESLERSNDG